MNERSGESKKVDKIRLHVERLNVNVDNWSVKLGHSNDTATCNLYVYARRQHHCSHSGLV